MNPLDELTLADLRRRRSIKWRTYPPDVLPLWVAEMDVPLATPVATAITDAAVLGDTGYALPATYTAAAADFAARRWGWTIPQARIGLVPDVMLGIVEVLKLVTRDTDAVVINSPVYPPFYAFVAHMNRRVVQAPLGADLRIDFDALEAAFSGAATGQPARAFLLCSPHNPTGTVHTREELEAVAALAARHGVRVVADEIHAPVVTADGAFVPYLTVDGAADGFSLLSASKGWNLAGLKAAVAVAGDAAVEFAALPEEVTHGASHVGVLAHVAALRDGGEWLDAMLAGVVANRRLLSDLLAEHLPQVRYRPGPGTYLAWLDCRALDVGPDPAAFFLEHARVALVAGTNFGTGGTGHARLNLATSPAIITEAVQRMGRAVAGRR